MLWFLPSRGMNYPFPRASHTHPASALPSSTLCPACLGWLHCSVSISELHPWLQMVSPLEHWLFPIQISDPLSTLRVSLTCSKSSHLKGQIFSLKLQKAPHVPSVSDPPCFIHLHVLRIWFSTLDSHQILSLAQPNFRSKIPTSHGVSLRLVDMGMLEDHLSSSRFPSVSVDINQDPEAHSHYTHNYFQAACSLKSSLLLSICPFLLTPPPPLILCYKSPLTVSHITNTHLPQALTEFAVCLIPTPYGID